MSNLKTSKKIKLRTKTTCRVCTIKSSQNGRFYPKTVYSNLYELNLKNVLIQSNRSPYTTVIMYLGIFVANKPFRGLRKMYGKKNWVVRQKRR